MGQSKSACIVLVAVFLVLIGTEPVAQAVFDWREGTAPTALDVFRRTPSPANLRAYEDGLREQSNIANALRPWMQYVRFSLMNDAGRNGLIGRDGWLFYRPGVQFLAEPWNIHGQEDDPLKAIVSFRDQLQARGIALVVLVAPGKESVYPMQLAGRATGHVNGHVEDFLALLRASGVECVYAGPERDDTPRAPQSDPEGPAYLAQDTHWTPARARAVAEEVADHAVARGWVQRGATVYDERAVSIERHGDVLRMAKSAPLLRAHAPEKIMCLQVIERASGNLYKDVADAPVLVLGDSFLRIFQSDEPGSA
ncbi:MAG: hypothetical protein FJY92_11240, partial [Candidatus Hydrogenedentes bacterium]|nr:hypothetical protein [Candidatus Hydrogenedentota bacterium]